VAVAASLRALLAGAVDYAGLYPPASVDMPTAVNNYDVYCRGEDAWMLGRLVVPIGGLDAFDAARSPLARNSSEPWRLSAVLGTDAPSDIARVHAFNESHEGGVQIDCIEARLSADDLRRAADATGDRLTLFVEVPASGDPESMLSTVAACRANAKIRTGGTTPVAFPRSAHVARFIRACIDHRLPFKATAGLHHPLRAEYRLTYQPDAVCGTMFGYLNVFLAAAFAAAGMSELELVRLLEETDASTLAANDRRLAWRGNALELERVTEARRWLRSFGSCSFREPVDELNALGLGT
jgi:hypothetical protein